MPQDHEFDECAKIVEIEKGIFTKQRCEECRRKMFDLKHSVERRQ